MDNICSEKAVVSAVSRHRQKLTAVVFAEETRKKFNKKFYFSQKFEEFPKKIFLRFRFNSPLRRYGRRYKRNRNRNDDQRVIFRRRSGNVFSSGKK